MSKKKKNKKQNATGIKNQETATQTQTTNVQSETRSDIACYTDCCYYRKNKRICALGVAPNRCDACKAYITLQIIKKKKDGETC